MALLATIPTSELLPKSQLVPAYIFEILPIIMGVKKIVVWNKYIINLTYSCAYFSWPPNYLAMMLS